MTVGSARDDRAPSCGQGRKCLVTVLRDSAGTPHDPHKLTQLTSTAPASCPRNLYPGVTVQAPFTPSLARPVIPAKRTSPSDPPARAAPSRAPSHQSTNAIPHHSPDVPSRHSSNEEGGQDENSDPRGKRPRDSGFGEPDARVPDSEDEGVTEALVPARNSESSGNAAAMESILSLQSDRPG